jgi:AcrR family transcriptional regulator
MGSAEVTEPAKRPRERLSREARRGQILRTATELFQNHSYEEISLDEIAERLGVTRTLINHHFGGKHELYLEVMRGVLSVEQIPIPDYVHGATLADRAAYSLDGWFDNVERNPQVFLAAIRAGGSGDQAVAEIAEQARENVAHRFIAILGLGPVEDVTAKEMGVVRAWAGLGEAATVQWIEYGRLTREQVRELALDVIVPGATEMLEARAEHRPGKSKRSSR